MKILVTGGAGYIGSHTIVELIAQEHTVVVVDNLINSDREVLHRLKVITGVDIPLHTFDLKDKDRLNELFSSEAFDAVIHFAGLKAVGESTVNPLLYYRNNIDSTLALLEVMDKHNVRRLVFSSSATVYGSAPVPYDESSPTGQGITNPYGETKYFIEQILTSVAKINENNQFTILRYFNPVGAHSSGLIGEYPNGTPNNLMPYITQVATGKREKLSVFGGDYDTVDGTGVRDYIHVTDLARGHLTALNHSSNGIETYNLGTGKGVSVLELIKAFEAVSGKSIPYEIIERRPGDLPEYYARTQKAADALDWHAEKTIDDACADSWNWQSKNPNGYQTSV